MVSASDSSDEETFRLKLAEVKRLRGLRRQPQQSRAMKNASSVCKSRRSRRRVFINGKQCALVLGPWAKMASASVENAFYFFHLLEQRAQWHEPDEWKTLFISERRGNNVDVDLTAMQRRVGEKDRNEESNISEGEDEIGKEAGDEHEPQEAKEGVEDANENIDGEVNDKEREGVDDDHRPEDEDVIETHVGKEDVVDDFLGEDVGRFSDDASPISEARKKDRFQASNEIETHSNDKSDVEAKNEVAEKTAASAKINFKISGSLVSKDSKETASNIFEEDNEETPQLFIPGQLSDEELNSSVEKVGRSEEKKGKKRRRPQNLRRRHRSTSSSASASSKEGRRSGSGGKRRRSSASEKSRSKSKAGSKGEESKGGSESPMSLIMAAKERIESEMGEQNSANRSSKGEHTVHSTENNPTWIGEHSFPAFLSRCKFPRLSDALHELQTNRSKKSNFSSNSSDDGEMARTSFLKELKASNSRHRQLGDRIGERVLKVPDDLWERFSHLFRTELLNGVHLEARAHGFTEEGKPVYSRTGRVASAGPFPEDVVRCHAVLQTWGAQLCHLVYANKTYLIEKEDNQWAKDIKEAKKCLKENGYVQ